MTLSLDVIATAGFRTSAEADQRAQRLKDVLGFGAYYVPARLAIGRSLAIPEMPPSTVGPASRSIKGDTLFGVGDDLATWASLIIAHAGRAPADLRSFQGLVAAHWARGLELLANMLEGADDNPSEFWRHVALSALPEGGTEYEGEGASEITSLAALPVDVPIGPVSTEHATDNSVRWCPAAGGGSPHAAIMGGVGSGKTRTACCILREMRLQTPVPLIAFDFKGDMADADNMLDRTFDAAVIAPPHQPVPLDVLALSDRGDMTVSLRHSACVTAWRH